MNRHFIEQMAMYTAYHRDGRNKATHFVGVPAIAFSLLVPMAMLRFGDVGGGLRRLIQIVFGLSIAFAATSFFLSFFSFAGGALIN